MSGTDGAAGTRTIASHIGQLPRGASRMNRLLNHSGPWEYVSADEFAVVLDVPAEHGALG